MEALTKYEEIMEQLDKEQLERIEAKLDKLLEEQERNRRNLDRALASWDLD